MSEAKIAVGAKTIGTPFDVLLGDVELRQMALLEGYRHGRGSGTLLFDRPPAARALERSEDGSLPALSDRPLRIPLATKQLRAETRPSTSLLIDVEDDLFGLEVRLVLPDLAPLPLRLRSASLHSFARSRRTATFASA